MKNLFLSSLVIIAISITSCKENTHTADPEVVTVDNTGQEPKTYEIAKTEAEFKEPKMEAVFNQQRFKF